MFDILKKLIFAREIQLERGYITLLGQRMLIIPAFTFVSMQKFGGKIDEKDINKYIYYSCKMAGSIGFTKKIIEKYKFSPEKTIKWQTDIAMLGGWGEFTHISTNLEKRESVVHFINSPIALLCFKSNCPVDHAIRGFVAAVAELVLQEPSETIETRCQAMGHEYCEIISKPKKYFNPKDNLVKTQLDLSGNIEKFTEDFYDNK